MSNSSARMSVQHWPRHCVSLVSCVVALGLVSLVGCGPPEEVRVANKGEIRSLMNVLSQGKGNLGLVEEMFVEGTAPPQRWFEQLSNRLIEVDEVTLDDNKATVTFTLETMTGEIEADYEWKFVHHDGKWMISEAPVPAP